DIAAGVDKALEVREDAADDDPLDQQGAGDQGLMFGYASDETSVLMPTPIFLAHRLSERLAAVRKDGTVPGLRPDGKTQVTIAYDDGRPVRLDTVLVSTQHEPDVTQDELREAIQTHVVEPVLSSAELDVDGYRLLTNPTGSFVVGGPKGDAGLTGRRSSSTPTGAWPATVAALSRARTPRRSTAPRPTRCAGSPRTSSRP